VRNSWTSKIKLLLQLDSNKAEMALILATLPQQPAVATSATKTTNAGTTAMAQTKVSLNSSSSKVGTPPSHHSTEQLLRSAFILP